jgi:hypothetical protein
MNIADFDAWRERYDEMTYEDMKEFYNLVEIDHPLQQAYDANAFSRFLDRAIASIGPVSVLEVGGWKGELAQKMLVKPGIVEWRNLEICERAVQKSVFSSPRYEAVIPDDFAWKVALPKADVLVASHFIEHVKWREFAALMSSLPGEFRFVGLQAPIQETETDWTGYHGTHILEVGWQDVSACLFTNSFVKIGDLCSDDFKAFVRLA